MPDTTFRRPGVDVSGTILLFALYLKLISSNRVSIYKMENPLRKIKELSIMFSLFVFFLKQKLQDIFFGYLYYHYLNSNILIF